MKRFVAILLLVVLCLSMTGCSSYSKNELLNAMDVKEADFNYVTMAEGEKNVIVLGWEKEGVTQIITKMEFMSMFGGATEDVSAEWMAVREEAVQMSKDLQAKLDAKYDGKATVEVAVCTSKNEVALRVRAGEITYNFVEGKA
ncbi:MAG: hypothetical protein IJP03_00915 [Christensenellaceae bacterium]|nr:hypothetical protein [Christensenellaceae bacterium]